MRLVGWREQRADFSKMRTEGFKDKQRIESEMARDAQVANRENQWQEIQVPDAEHPEERETT